MIPADLPQQVLTLANGDRIQMTAQMKTLFEPEHLANASPATVSRAGIIYVSNVRLFAANCLFLSIIIAIALTECYSFNRLILAGSLLLMLGLAHERPMRVHN